MRRASWALSCALPLCAVVLALGSGCGDEGRHARSDSTAASPARRDPPSSELYFRRFLQDRGVDVVRMTPAQGVAAMLDFYDAAKFNVVPDGDVLRVIWSSHDAQTTFRVSRELTWTAGNPDSRVERWALWLKYEFSRVDRSQVPEGDGSRQCSGAHAREECDAFIQAMPLYRVVKMQNSDDVQVGFDSIEGN